MSLVSRFGPVCHSKSVRIPISRGALVPPSSWVASYRRTPPVCVHLAAGGGGRAARTRRVLLSIQRREKHRVDPESIAVQVLAAVGRWDGLMRGRVRGQRAIVRPTRTGLPHLNAQLARHAGRRGPGCHGHSAARTQPSIRSVVEFVVISAVTFSQHHLLHVSVRCISYFMALQVI